MKSVGLDMARSFHAQSKALAAMTLAAMTLAVALVSAPAWANGGLVLPPVEPQTAPTEPVPETQMALAPQRDLPPDLGGYFSVTLENDIFSGTDRDYTNGVRFDFISGRDDLTAFGRLARRNLGWLTSAQDWYEIYAIGQNMYTPSDITVVVPSASERPYAGFLYGSIGVAADRGDRLDTLALDIGVVGDPSLAERSQKVVHDLIDVDKPVGWASQLDEEPAFRLLYERKYRFATDFPLRIAGFGADLAPHGNLSLGTVDTSAGLGFTFRIGRNLSDDYGPPRVRPAVAGPGFFDGDAGLSGYLFAGAEGRVVGRNLFLEGNTLRSVFGGKDGVTINRFGADFQLGAALQYGAVEVSYTHVLRTEEYAAQDRFGEFGSVNIRTRF